MTTLVMPSNRRAIAFLLLVCPVVGCSPFLSRSAKSGPACPPVDMPARLARPNAVILLGELHGTEQAPRFVGDLACALTSRGLPVTVALELPLESSSQLGRLVTDDRPNANDRQALFGSTWQDGRRSSAIAGLVERLAAMRRTGANVEVASYAPDSAPTAQERDDGMSRALAALAANRRVLIVLSGNLHNRLRSGTAISPQYRPAGFALMQLIEPARITSLDMGYEAGTAWLCSGPTPADCGLRRLGARHPMAFGRISLFDSLDAEGYQGRFGGGPIAAALPAIPK